MPYQDLIDYISSARSKGFDDQKIKAKLLSSGWLASAIDEAFKHQGSISPGAGVSGKLNPVGSSGMGLAPQKVPSESSHFVQQEKLKVDSSRRPLDKEKVASESEVVTKSAVPLDEQKLVPGIPTYKPIFPPQASVGPLGVSKTETSAEPVVASPFVSGVPDAGKPSNPKAILPTSPTTVPKASEASLVQSPSGKQSFGSHKLAVSLSAIFLLLLIAAGGVGVAAYYGFVKAPFISPSPNIVWERFSSGLEQSEYAKQFKTELVLEYKDLQSKLKPEVEQELLAGQTLTSLSASVTLKGYMEDKSSETSQVNMDAYVEVALENGNAKYSVALPMLMKDKNLYLNIKNSPAVANALGLASGGNTEWVRLSTKPEDLAKLSAGSPDFSETDIEVSSLLQSVDMEKVLHFMEEHPAFTTAEHRGAEVLHGQKTYKYELVYSKANVQSIVDLYLEEMIWSAGGNTNLDQASVDTVKGFVREWTSRMNFDPLEVWVGQYDYLPYRVKTSGQVVSVISVMNAVSEMVSESFGSTAEGEKKLSDVSQIGFALDLYRNEFGGYPPSLEGQAVGLAPDYLPAWPVAPQATGVCSEWDNTYWYTGKGEMQDNGQGKLVYPDYEFTFCLEKPYGGFTLGAGTMSPEAGIKVGGQTACAGEGCQTAGSELARAFEDMYKKFEYNAGLTFTMDLYEYGLPQVISVPEGAVDIADLVASQGVTEDTTQLGAEGVDMLSAQILNEVRRYLSALELYYTDTGEYPASLNDLNPEYLASDKPLEYPALGVCTKENSAMVYTKLAPDRYGLKFCLPAISEGYEAGERTASQEGIK